MDLLNDLKKNLSEKYPSNKGHFESVSFQYARVIFKRRMELGVTQRELAKSAGVSLKTITRAEAGSKNVTIDSFEKIFKGLHLSVQDVSKAIVEINEANDQSVATN